MALADHHPIELNELAMQHAAQVSLQRQEGQGPLDPLCMRCGTAGPKVAFSCKGAPGHPSRSRSRTRNRVVARSPAVDGATRFIRM